MANGQPNDDGINLGARMRGEPTTTRRAAEVSTSRRSREAPRTPDETRIALQQWKARIERGQPETSTRPVRRPPSRPTPVPEAATGADALALLERLATLHASGVLTAEEFTAKKRELLDRL